MTLCLLNQYLKSMQAAQWKQLKKTHLTFLPLSLSFCNKGNLLLFQEMKFMEEQFTEQPLEANTPLNKLPRTQSIILKEAMAQGFT